MTAQQAEEQVEEEGEGKEGTTSVHCSDLWISNEVHIIMVEFALVILFSYNTYQ